MSLPFLFAPPSGAGGSATAPTGSGAIKTTLDKLFAPALVTWNVTIASAITVADITEEGFKTTGLSMASRYTSDMNKVIKAYKETHKIAKNTLVLFFVTSPNSDKMGYMPLTGDYGFIFNLSSNVELLAHELSHGAFNLRHTFSDDAYWRGNGKAPVFPEKTTQNLMDYANGTELWKYQWDLIHDPEGILFGALDEEEGAYVDPALYAAIQKKKMATLVELVDYVKNNNLWVSGDSYQSRINTRDAIMKDYFIVYNDSEKSYKFDNIACLNSYRKNGIQNTYELSRYCNDAEKPISNSVLTLFDLLLFDGQYAKKKAAIAQTEERKRAFELCQQEYDDYILNKNIQIGKDAVLIVGGAVTIYFSAGIATPWVAGLAIASGTCSVVGGSIKLALDLSNNIELSGKIPSGLLDFTVGTIVQITLEDKTSYKVRAILNVSEGLFLLKIPSNLKFDEIDNLFTGTNITITVLDYLGTIKD